MAPGLEVAYGLHLVDVLPAGQIPAPEHSPNCSIVNCLLLTFAHLASRANHFFVGRFTPTIGALDLVCGVVVNARLVIFKSRLAVPSLANGLDEVGPTGR